MIACEQAFCEKAGSHPDRETERNEIDQVSPYFDDEVSIVRRVATSSCGTPFSAMAKDLSIGANSDRTLAAGGAFRPLEERREVNWEVLQQTS